MQPQSGQCPCGVRQGWPLCNRRTWVKPSTAASLGQGEAGNIRWVSQSTSKSTQGKTREQMKEWCPMEQKNTRWGNRYPSLPFPGKVVSGRPGHNERSHLTYCDPLPYETVFILRHHSGNISRPAAPQGEQAPRPWCWKMSHVNNGLPTPHPQSFCICPVLEFSLGTPSGLPPI